MKKILEFFNKDKRIEKYLNENGFTKVPISWPKEMQSLGDKYANSVKTVRLISGEYNALLKDFVSQLTANQIKTILETIDMENLPKGKADLQALYISAFEISFNEDKEEVIKPGRKETKGGVTNGGNKKTTR